MFFLSVVDISFSVYVLHLKQVIHVEIIKHIFDHTEKKNGVFICNTECWCGGIKINVKLLPQDNYRLCMLGRTRVFPVYTG